MWIGGRGIEVAPNACPSTQNHMRSTVPMHKRGAKEKDNNAHGHAPMTFDKKAAVQYRQIEPLRDVQGSKIPRMRTALTVYIR